MLDLDDGVIDVSYARGGARFRRQVFASHPDDVIVIRLTCGGGGSWTGSLTLAGTRGEIVTAGPGDATVSFASALGNGLRYAALVTAAGSGGTVAANGPSVTFDGCAELTLVLSGATSYVPDAAAAFMDRGADPLREAAERAAAAAALGPQALLARHRADYRRLAGRMSVSLGRSSAAQRAMTTPARLAARAASGAPDPELEAAYLMFARYLLISGSRGSLPVSLQGLWIDTNTPAWKSDYHTDVNLQMVYWLAGRAGLAACFGPLADYCVAQHPSWERATRELFQDERNGFRNSSGAVAGWTTAISVNPYGGNGWWWHVAGSAWLCNSLFEHYEYTLDAEYLGAVYPLLKGACEFWEARLVQTTVEDPWTGGRRAVLVDDRDWSPEHGPADAVGISYAQELAWQLFANYRQAAAALRRDPGYAEKVAGWQKRLYLPEVSPVTGWLQEWMAPENLGDPAHRHLSPLAGLFPGDRVNLQDSPCRLLDGARRLLAARGMESYGWAEAWRALCWARLKDPERAYRLLGNVLRPAEGHGNGTAANLFDIYQLGAAESVFQVDANMGAAAAMIEMLVQSRPGRVEVLPALPAAWAAEGHLHGAGARPGLTVDVDWSDGAATAIRLRGRPGTATTVVAGAWSEAATIPARGALVLHPPGNSRP